MTACTGGDARRGPRLPARVPALYPASDRVTRTGRGNAVARTWLSIEVVLIEGHGVLAEHVERVDAGQIGQFPRALRGQLDPRDRNAATSVGGEPGPGSWSRSACSASHSRRSARSRHSCAGAGNRTQRPARHRRPSEPRASSCVCRLVRVTACVPPVPQATCGAALASAACSSTVSTRPHGMRLTLLSPGLSAGRDGAVAPRGRLPSRAESW